MQRLKHCIFFQERIVILQRMSFLVVKQLPLITCYWFYVLWLIFNWSVFGSRIGLDWACTVADILHSLNACPDWSTVIAAFTDHCIQQLPHTLKRTNLFTLLVLVGFPEVGRTCTVSDCAYIIIPGFLSSVVSPPLCLFSGAVCGHPDSVYWQRQWTAQHDLAQTLHRKEPSRCGGR